MEAGKTLADMTLLITGFFWATTRFALTTTAIIAAKSVGAIGFTTPAKASRITFLWRLAVTVVDARVTTGT
jgi:hypothetical protein